MKWLVRMMKETNWLMIVAHAAPAMPILKPKIRIGSRMTLRIAPLLIPIIPRYAFPSLRRLLFIV